MKVRLTALAVLVLAGLAAAQDAKNPDQTLPCWNKAKAQPEMNDCANQEFGAADKEMNDVYAKVMASMKGDADGIASFKKAQRAWVAFRDAEVAALYPGGPDAGSLTPMCGSLEMAHLTRQRTAELKRILKGLDCVV
jgi:uncharacterized protein YecT (DUF1311 family)